jgi:hypothetical protein
MSVVKLLSRITTADALEKERDRDALVQGITSDPLTQFAGAFATLIHDGDHAGVPNAQLIKEYSHLGHVYRNQGIAEQNSVHVAWELFMGIGFAELRKLICWWRLILLIKS